MAAPVAANRVTPTARQMPDGFGTLVVITLDTNIELYEKSVTPPGIQGDAPVETTSNLNIQWRTKSPRTLMMMTDLVMSCGYDPKVWNSIQAIVNRPTTITLHYPTGDKLAFFGFLLSFIPGPLVEGTKPEATVTIVPTNQDPTNCVEEDPVFVAGLGTYPC